MMGVVEDIKKPGAPVILYVDDILGIEDVKRGSVMSIARDNINRVAKALGFENCVNVVYSDSAKLAEEWIERPANAERVVLAIVDNDFSGVGEKKHGVELADDVERHNHLQHAEILWCSNTVPTQQESKKLHEIDRHGAHVHLGPHQGSDHHYIRNAFLTGLPKISDEDVRMLAQNDPDFLPRDDLENRALSTVVAHLQRAFSKIRNADLQRRDFEAGAIAPKTRNE